MNVPACSGARVHTGDAAGLANKLRTWLSYSTRLTESVSFSCFRRNAHVLLTSESLSPAIDPDLSSTSDRLTGALVVPPAGAASCNRHVAAQLLLAYRSNSVWYVSILEMRSRQPLAIAQSDNELPMSLLSSCVLSLHVCYNVPKMISSRLHQL